MPEQELTEALWSAIEQGNTAGVVRSLAKLDETGRRKLASMVPQVAKALSDVPWIAGEKVIGRNGKPLKVELYDYRDAATALLAAVATHAELKKLSRFWLTDGAKQALTLRNPPWLREFIEENLNGRGRASWWSFARQLLKSGNISRPEGEGYVLGLIDWTFWSIHDEAKSLADYLQAEPDLLEEVWRLFEVEGGGETSLANSDKYRKGRPEYGWPVALRALANRGLLDRQRLLDESLKTLARDFAQYRAGWYSRFHEFMEPTIEERAARVDAYCNLLSSNIQPTVSFALKALEKLQKAGKLAPQPFLGVAHSALQSDQKGTAKLAVRMLELFAKDENTRQDALQASAVALEHPAAEVQEAALKLYRKYGLPGGLNLADYADALAAPVRQEYADLLGSVSSATAEPAADNDGLVKTAKAIPEQWARLAGLPAVLKALEQGTPAPALELDPALTPRLHRDQLIKPIEDLDELVECASRVMEEPNNPDDIERMIDGVCRLCDKRPSDFDKRTAQLAKRARQRAESGWGGFQERSDLTDIAVLLLNWLTRQEHPLMEAEFHNIRWNGVGALMLRPRLVALLPRIRQGKAFQPLSTPTHQGGWVNPGVLAARAVAAEELLPEDAIVAMLRLAPDHREEAFAAMGSVKGEVAAALRYACGGPLPKTGVKEFALWHPASLGRSFGRGDAQVARLFEDSRQFFERPTWVQTVVVEKRDKYTFHYLVLKGVWGKKPERHSKLASTCSVHLIGEQYRAGLSGYADTVRWMATHYKACPEVFFSVGAGCLGNNLDWDAADWAHRAYLEPLLDADCPMEPMATLCLALGLAAKEPGEHGLATDVLIRAVEDGRIDGNKLGAAMGSLLFTGLVKPPRWTRTLGETARVSPLHAQVVRLAIERALSGAGNAEPPKGLNELLELCHQLAVEAGAELANTAAREFLDGLTGGNKTTKAAKALLKLSPDANSNHAAQALNQALAGRIHRAKRWAEP